MLAQSASIGRPRVVVLDDLEQSVEKYAAWDHLLPHIELTVHTKSLVEAKLVEAIRDVEVLVCVRDRTPITEELLCQLPKLKYLVHTGPRNLKVDHRALAARDIPCSYTPMQHSKNSTAELCWALIMSSYKRIVEQHCLITHEHGWRNSTSVLPVLRGERLGILGLGSIGKQISAYAHAFGMDVVAWSPNLTPERVEVHNAETKEAVQAVSLETLLSTSRIISLHLPAVPATKGLLQYAQLSSMRNDSVLINTSRSSLVVTEDLVRSLGEGRPGQVALDVHDVEPIPTSALLTELPNVLLTPHLGFIAEPNMRQCAEGIVENLEAYLNGAPLKYIITPPAN